MVSKLDEKAIREWIGEFPEINNCLDSIKSDSFVGFHKSTINSLLIVLQLELKPGQAIDQTRAKEKLLQIARMERVLTLPNTKVKELQQWMEVYRSQSHENLSNLFGTLASKPESQSGLLLIVMTYVICRQQTIINALMDVTPPQVLAVTVLP